MSKKRNRIIGNFSSRFRARRTGPFYSGQRARIHEGTCTFRRVQVSRCVECRGEKERERERGAKLRRSPCVGRVSLAGGTWSASWFSKPQMVPPVAHDYGFLSSMPGAGGRARCISRSIFAAKLTNDSVPESRSGNDSRTRTHAVLGIILGSAISY